MKIDYDLAQQLKVLGCSSPYDRELYAYLNSIAQMNQGLSGYFRYKDLEYVLATSRPTISASLKRLKAAGLLDITVAGTGSAKQSNFTIKSKDALQLKVKQLYSKKLSSFTNKSKAALQITIDTSNSIDNKHINTNKEVLPAKAGNESLKAKHKKTTKPDHPATDELHSKLLSILQSWKLPMPAKANRDPMRLLLTTDKVAPETIAQVICYLEWRGADNNLKQKMHGRPPNEIRSIAKFRKSFAKLTAEFEFMREKHSKQSKHYVTREKTPEEKQLDEQLGQNLKDYYDL